MFVTASVCPVTTTTVLCRESNPGGSLFPEARVASRTVNDFQRYFRPFSLYQKWDKFNKIVFTNITFFPLNQDIQNPKKVAKSYSCLRWDVYICWESDLPWYSMLCYCVRKSKHRVNRDNTLLYSARFNLVKPSHADSKNVTQMEQNYQPRTVCSFLRELQYDEFKLTQTRVGIRSYVYFIFCAIVTTFYICIDLVKMSNKFKRISISMIIIILI